KLPDAPGRREGLVHSARARRSVSRTDAERHGDARHRPRPEAVSGAAGALLARTLLSQLQALPRGSEVNSEMEIIALLLADTGEKRWRSGDFGKGAQCLVRDPDGRVSLKAVESAEAFERAARRSGCFRRGSPIRDPQTKEI